MPEGLGNSVATVTDRAWTTSQNRAASPGPSTTKVPAVASVVNRKCSPATWNNGSCAQTTSRLDMPVAWAQPLMLDSHPRWVKRQPFGRPVVPEV